MTEPTRTVGAAESENVMDAWWMVFFWSGPIGVGIFLVCLGTFILLVAKADAVSKRTKAELGRGQR